MGLTPGYLGYWRYPTPVSDSDPGESEFTVIGDNYNRPSSFMVVLWFSSVSKAKRSLLISVVVLWGSSEVFV